MAFVCRKQIIKNRIALKKQITYHKLLLFWDLNDKDNVQIKSFIQKEMINSVLIYGAGDLGKIFFGRIKDVVKVKAFVDKRIKGSIDDVAIISVDEVQNIYEVGDVIVITPFMDSEMIQKQLFCKLGKNVKILALDDIVYSIEEK